MTNFVTSSCSFNTNMYLLQLWVIARNPYWYKYTHKPVLVYLTATCLFRPFTGCLRQAWSLTVIAVYEDFVVL